jgi:hypothetical protein
MPEHRSPSTALESLAMITLTQTCSRTTSDETLQGRDAGCMAAKAPTTSPHLLPSGTYQDLVIQA